MDNPCVDHVHVLASLRHALEKAKAEQKQIADELAATLLGTALATVQKKVSELSASVAAEEEQVRAEILAAWEAGGKTEKKQRGGQIKHFDDLMTYSEVDAIGFAVEKNFPSMLKLDKKAFEAAARGLRPVFVTFYSEDKAQIDGDLSAFLPKE